MIQVTDTRFLRKEEDKYYFIKHYENYYCNGYRVNIPKIRKKTIGYFFIKDGTLFFKFAGKSFKMSHSKQYEASIKQIDLSNATWISMNEDRRPIRKPLNERYLTVALVAYEHLMRDVTEKIILGTP